MRHLCRPGYHIIELFGLHRPWQDGSSRASLNQSRGTITPFSRCFDDTDTYRIIEGASYSIQTFPDKKLEAHVDSLITYVAAAQEPDGYLYTARSIDPAHAHEWSGMKRWEKKSDLSHELCHSGHLFEAPVAHYLATGKKTLLNVATKNADLLVKDFGPGKLHYSPGHQIAEMGLMKLYRIAGAKQYLDLAKLLLDVRGRGNEYSQDHMPIGEAPKRHHPVGTIRLREAHPHRILERVLVRRRPVGWVPHSGGVEAAVQSYRRRAETYR